MRLVIANNNFILLVANLLLCLLFHQCIPVNGLIPSQNIDARREPIGRITKLDRSKLDKQSDSTFYARPNLVTHTDDKFIARLTELYEEVLPENGIVLDIMSSHVSHLPTTSKKTFERVDVHGMNVDELNQNPARRNTNGYAFVRNLNDNPSFVDQCKTSEYDAVLCCVGVQYLEEPEAVFAEIARILKPNGICVVSFSNKLFYQKALQGWIERGMSARARLVSDYFRAAGGFSESEVEIVGDGRSVVSQFLGMSGIGGDPFVAVIAKRDGL